jgi:hypothetical protein
MEPRMPHSDSLDDRSRAARARKALLSMSKPTISPFIAADRLVKSEIFAEIVDMATDHALRTGDYNYMNLLLDLVSLSKHEKPLLDWFCSTVGATASVKDGRPRLTKSSTAQRTSIPLSRIFPSAVAAQRMAREEARTSDPRLPVVEVPEEPYIDMLDSHARLPGSFGARKGR